MNSPFGSGVCGSFSKVGTDGGLGGGAGSAASAQHAVAVTSDVSTAQTREERGSRSVGQIHMKSTRSRGKTMCTTICHVRRWFCDIEQNRNNVYNSPCSCGEYMIPNRFRRSAVSAS